MSEGHMYVSGHNLRKLKRTSEHNKKIGDAQKKAWRTVRKRKPLGSTCISKCGYVLVKVIEGKGPWRAEHLLVMEKEIGRRLKKQEVVHHINGDRTDNRIENLYLCKNRSHHNDVHRTQDVALRELLSQGKVVFREGRYEALL